MLQKALRKERDEFESEHSNQIKQQPSVKGKEHSNNSLITTAFKNKVLKFNGIYTLFLSQKNLKLRGNMKQQRVLKRNWKKNLRNKKKGNLKKKFQRTMPQGNRLKRFNFFNIFNLGGKKGI